MILWLYLIGLLDAAGVGYTEAAGRDARIDKRDYYRRAVLRSVLWSQLSMALVVALAWHWQPPGLEDSLNVLGACLTPGALLSLLCLALRRWGSVDVCCMTSTLFFGPFSLVRPALAGLALALAVRANPSYPLLGLAVVTWILMVGHGTWLRRLP